MGDEPRATVVPFPAIPPRGGRGYASHGAGGGVVFRPWDDNDPDAGHNATWDELLRLVDQAWTWRDPEALNQIEACLLRLAIVVEADWS